MEIFEDLQLIGFITAIFVVSLIVWGLRLSKRNARSTPSTPTPQPPAAGAVPATPQPAAAAPPPAAKTAGHGDSHKSGGLGMWMILLLLLLGGIGSVGWWWDDITTTKIVLPVGKTTITLNKNNMFSKKYYEIPRANCLDYAMPKSAIVLVSDDMKTWVEDGVTGRFFQFHGVGTGDVNLYPRVEGTCKKK